MVKFTLFVELHVQVEGLNLLCRGVESLASLEVFFIADHVISSSVDLSIQVGDTFEHAILTS